MIGTKFVDYFTKLSDIARCLESVIEMETLHKRQNELGSSGRLTIDLAAVRKNYEALAGELAPARLAAVVKANAYGLMADRVGPVLYASGCRDFFVAHFNEAAALRDNLNDDARIYVLSGLQPGTETACAAAAIIPVLNSMDQYERWKSTAVSIRNDLQAVVQFDTGMSRLGVPPRDRGSLATALAESGAVRVMFMMSHIACADEPDSSRNAEQLVEMQKISSEFPALGFCFANSGGIFLGRQYHGVLARAGIALYGGAPAPGRLLQAVVRLDVAVIQTRTVPAGSFVGYGATHVAGAEMRVATIAAGYADGLPRCLSGRGAVYFKGVRLPIVGRVSMDSITVDISALSADTIQLGDMVEVIGPHQTLEDLAESAGTIS